jgi:hypothetical protein
MNAKITSPGNVAIIRGLLMLTVLSVVSCTKHPPQPSADGFVTFDSFIQQTRSAKFEDYQGKPGVQVESAAAFEEMKAHLLQLYEGVHPTNTFFERNRFVDCVPLEQQPGLRRPGAPRESLQRPNLKETSAPSLQNPESDATGRKTESIDITLKPGVRDSFGREMYCAEGTFPMQRLTLTQLTRFKNLRSFFRKGSLGDNFELRPNRNQPHPIPGDDSTHYYARGVQWVDNFGGDAWLDLWSPTVADSHMSLSQLWIVGGDGDSKQTAEAGWQVYSGEGSNARLFIYYTTKGYADGCYNTECSGFVQVANNVYLGSGFDHYSTAGGTQWGFNLQWKRHTDGNWWLFYRGPGDYIAVGYYPHSLYGDGAMATKSAKVAFGGEDTGSSAAKQMGSGEKANAGWQHAAYQHTIFYIDTNTTSQWANLDKYESNPDCYTADVHNIYGSWGTYLYFGGPDCP